MAPVAGAFWQPWLRLFPVTLLKIVLVLSANKIIAFYLSWMWQLLVKFPIKVVVITIISIIITIISTQTIFITFGITLKQRQINSNDYPWEWTYNIPLSSPLPTKLILPWLNEWGYDVFLSFYLTCTGVGVKIIHVSTILQHQRFIKFFLFKASSRVAGLK